MPRQALLAIRRLVAPFERALRSSGGRDVRDRQPVLLALRHSGVMVSLGALVLLHLLQLGYSQFVHFKSIIIKICKEIY